MDLDAVHLGILSTKGNTAPSRRGRMVDFVAASFCRAYGGNHAAIYHDKDGGALLRVLAGSRWTITGDREKCTVA